MKLEAPDNEAYSATIVKVKNTYPLDGLDNLVGVSILGYNALVPKNYEVGLYVMFGAETQLSEEFCKQNNLFRDKKLNSDKEADGGYIENNRRVKAIKLRGHVSSCMLLPLSSLEYTKVDTTGFKEGDTFDKINGIRICQKYVIKDASGAPATKQQPKFSRVDKRLLPEHIKTEAWYRHEDKYRANDVVVTQKLHGCFSSDTLISMWDGTQKRISEIISGDELLGYKDGKIVKAKAKRDAITNGETLEWQKLTINGATVVHCTPDHKFFTHNRGWIQAKDLESTDELVIDNGDEGSLADSKVVGVLEHQFSTKWDIETTTSNFFANHVLVHNSSIRVGNIPVSKELSWYEKILAKLGIHISDKEFDYIYGSRRVIKDPEKDQKHFYDNDVWTEVGFRYRDSIPKNYIVYGEIIGYSNGKSPIQSHYTYNLPVDNNEMYVYRVAFINEDGVVADLSWDQVVEFCTIHGLKHVPEMWRGKGKDLNPDTFINKRYFDMGYKQCLPLSNKKTVDEGICIRYDGLTPSIAKLKSPEFLAFETKMLDEGNEGMEKS